VLMQTVQEAILFPHAWVRAASCRLLALYLGRRDVSGPRLRTSVDGIEILTMPNGLYDLSRRLCIVLNQPRLTDALLNSAVNALVFVIR
jgi:U3 small nucleolar RNA-associated protein 20